MSRKSELKGVIKSEIKCVDTGGWESGGVKCNFFTFLLSLDQKNRWNTATRLQNKVIVKDGLCNHLNEKEESQNKDTYDHACPVTISGHAIGLDDSST